MSNEKNRLHEFFNDNQTQKRVIISIDLVSIYEQHNIPQQKQFSILLKHYTFSCNIFHFQRTDNNNNNKKDSEKEKNGKIINLSFQWEN